MQIILITDKVLQQNFILSGINQLTCFSRVFLKGELMLWFAYRIFSLRNITFTITTIITVSVTKVYFFLALTKLA